MTTPPAGDCKCIEIEVKLDLKDAFSLCLWTVYRSTLMGRAVSVSCAVLPVAAALFVLFASQTPAPSLPWEVPLLWFTVPLIWFVLLPLFMYLSTKRQVSSNPLFGVATQYRFTSQGMEYENEFGSGRVIWARFYRLVETENSFYLLVATNQAVTIPKRFFGAQELIDDFRELLRSVDTVDRKKLLE